ncbi:MAG: hypothetical protein Q9184_006396 [Pyrenodesmia sp. 2 TL-2023]
MARPTTPPILSELRSSTSPASQVAALRALKHEIVGHEQKKRMWAGLGVLVQLERILNASKVEEKRRDPNENGTGNHCKSPLVKTDEEEARLQAIIIVGSLAHGGPAYIPPITAGAVIAPMISILSTIGSSASTVLATLRTLNTIADASSLSQRDAKDRDKGLFHDLYTDEALASVVRLLSQQTDSRIVQQQVSLAAALIAKTCRDESQRSLLVHTGVLEVLGIRLTDYAWCISSGPCSSSALPDVIPLSTQSRLAPILGAIGAIIDVSRPRALHFLSNTALTAISLKLGADVAAPLDRKVNVLSHLSSMPKGSRPLSSHRLEFLLPRLPGSPHKGTPPETNSHPPLGAGGTSVRQSYSARAPQHAQEVIHSLAGDPPHEAEYPLVPWLIYIVRACSGLTRLMAAWIVSLFHSSGVVDKRRDLSFAMLLVPLLVHLLDKESILAAEDQVAYDANPLQPVNLTSQQQAPSVLATLMVDSLESQRAAVDAGAIKRLAQLLKESYNPTPKDSYPSGWSAEPLSEDGNDSSTEVLFISDAINDTSALQTAKVREAILTALASLASTRDDYRKAIIDNGVVPFVIESLKPYHRSCSGAISDSKAGANFQDSSDVENPSGVILAACAATRSLSRSVTTLRTSLMDAGVAAPLFVLLKHHDINVQVAATTAISNLVLEFSPMREAILESGILKTLCDHARALDPNLRLSSIWALKHLILSAPRNLKKECLGELGPGWLKRIICHDGTDPVSFTGSRSDRDPSMSTPLAMGTPNAAGEQVDLLNAIDGLREGSRVANEDEEEESRMVDSVGALSRASGRRNVIGAANQLKADDLAVQKEGLDFIRNLICGNDSLEMIDCLFEELGQEKLFEILMSKLRPHLSNAFNRDRRSSENSVRQSPPQADIVTSVCYIMVHLAAGRPWHRQLLISQPDLLRAILPFFAHPSHEVRSACTWIAINLTWTDDQSDQPGCRDRARELYQLGWYRQLEDLKNDPELDVRERVKTALHQISSAMA